MSFAARSRSFIAETTLAVEHAMVGEPSRRARAVSENGTEKIRRFRLPLLDAVFHLKQGRWICELERVE